MYPYDFMFYDEKAFFEKTFQTREAYQAPGDMPGVRQDAGNIYRRDGVWKCKKCWDKEDEEE